MLAAVWLAHSAVLDDILHASGVAANLEGVQAWIPCVSPTSNAGREMILLSTLRFDDDLDPLELGDEDEDELIEDEAEDDLDDEDGLGDDEGWLSDDDDEPPYTGDEEDE